MRFLIDKNTGETCLNFNDEDLETIKKNNNTLIFDKVGLQHFKNHLAKIVTDLVIMSEKDPQITSFGSEDIVPQDISKK
jgi:hypothetical protein|tara:strand:- start:67 stop:303 length:237 start_codon:yes stop_codon:yes gene_type:complete